MLAGAERKLSMIKLVTLLCSVLLLTANANATVSFWYQDGNWTVWNGKSECSAVNRPVIETNHTPFMSFWLTRAAHRKGVLVKAYFWPGALAAGQKYDIDLSGGGQDVRIPAEAMNDFEVRTNRPLSRQEISLLAKQDLLIVQVEGTSARMAVDAIRLSVIMSKLRACADLLDRDDLN